ncbi:PAN domain protein [Oesophagostomum dentatum]|uniref:PAN domain protein n=1 Tax=Oesophagostomum dentatum TaxID=61180 RepID=A0A0B1S621_OESDE|nr:PAN domain protein [Oesophagostomum dentatum]
MRTVTFLAFLLVQMSPTKPCSFIRISGEFMAAVKFKIRVESENFCLAICFDELDCTFVGYSERTCTVFIDGTNSMMSNGSVLKFERDTPRPECRRSVEFGIPVEFQQIPVDKTENEVTCSGLPSATTVISTFYDINYYRFYAKEDDNLSSGMSKGYSFTFARNLQSHCTSVPVFTRAGKVAILSPEIA